MGQIISFIDDDELQMHKLYRERIVQEDNLINHRMMWMVLSEAFLLVLWATVAQKQLGYQLSLLRAMMAFISIVGILISIGSWASISAAHGEIDELRSKYVDVFKNGNNRLPGLTGSKHYHPIGHLVTKYFPAVLTVVWIILFFSSFFTDR